MNQLTNAAIYIALGLFGGLVHYLKKRYVDGTTDKSFMRYLLDDKSSTWRAVTGIASAEIGLAALQAGEVMALTELIGALSVGYSFDSTLNRSGQ
jgi:hypothetical protein